MKIECFLPVGVREVVRSTKKCYLPLSAAKYISLLKLWSQCSEFVMTRWVAREDVPEYSY
jgi:hypothetical protein